MPAPQRHIFVCVNERPVGGKPSCGSRPGGGPALFAALQRAVGAHSQLWAEVAVTGCGCLGPCFDGPNLVIYPEAIWYAGATADDADEIVAEHLLGGRPVERLRYRFPEDDEQAPGGEQE
jgi:(2Fe-2S) ferredoxin